MDENITINIIIVVLGLKKTVGNSCALWFLIILTLNYWACHHNRTCWNFVVGISSQENIAICDIIVSNNQACESQRNKKCQGLQGSLTSSCRGNYLLGLDKSFCWMICCPRKYCDTQSFCQFLSGETLRFTIIRYKRSRYRYSKRQRA